MRHLRTAATLSIAIVCSVFFPHSEVVATKTPIRASIRSSGRAALSAVHSADSADNSLASVLAQAAPGYRPLGVSEIDGHSYMVFTSGNRTKRDVQEGSGRGYLDVFDSHGNRVRRFSAIEQSDSEWQLNEYVPVDPDTLARIRRKAASSQMPPASD